MNKVIIIPPTNAATLRGTACPSHVEGQPGDATLPSLEELNAQFPQLEITRLVGRGGMGAIYHARQTALDRDVALKLIAKEVSSNAAFVERFEREARPLAKCSVHCTTWPLSTWKHRIKSTTDHVSVSETRGN